MEFGSFLGNFALREKLTGAQRRGRLSHSYLLCGPEGAGKHTLSRILAAAMQCTSDAAVPCGSCNACRKVMSGQHPDVIDCVDAKHKQYGVDSARSVCADVFLRPNEGNRKIYIFAQELNLAAQNTLLKVIEEPPAYAAFLFLTANAERMLPTVRSRCQELQLAPLDAQTLLAALRQRCPGRSPADYDAAASVSGGYLGQALAALSDGGLSGRTAQFADAYGGLDPLKWLTLLAGMEKFGRDDFCAELDRWCSVLHQAVRCACGLPGSEAAQAIARTHDRAQLLAAIDTLRLAAERARSNVGVGHLCGALSQLLS